MRRISFSSTFFKDILFNKTTHLKYTLVNKVLICVGLSLNCISFFISSLTGIPFVRNVDVSLRMMNVLFILGFITIKHRFNVNNFNIAKDVSSLENFNSSLADIEDIDIIPKNFAFNEELPLKMLRKIYKEGAYIVITTRENEFVLYTQEDEVFLLDEHDEDKLDNVRKLKLSRELI